MIKENDDQGSTKTLLPTNMTGQASVYKQEAHTLGQVMKSLQANNQTHRLYRSTLSYISSLLLKKSILGQIG